MATLTLNINPVKALTATNKSYNYSILTDPINMFILIGDSLGKEPTIITNITSFSLGTLVIDETGSMVVFTSNGTLGTDTFNYTITDSLARTSTATITITTS